MKKLLTTLFILTLLICLAVSASALSLESPFDGAQTAVAVFDENGKMLSFSRGEKNLDADVPAGGRVLVASVASGALSASSDSVLLDLKNADGFEYDTEGDTLTLTGANVLENDVISGNPWLLIDAEKVVIAESVQKIAPSLLEKITSGAEVTYNGSQSELQGKLLGEGDFDISFTKQDILYSVAFINNNQSQFSLVAKGAVPVYEGSTALEGFEFKGWQSNLDNKLYTALPLATADVIYTAVYEAVEIPEQPDTPDVPDVPDTPDTPDNPDTPVTPPNPPITNPDTPNPPVTEPETFTVIWSVNGQTTVEQYQKGQTPIFSGSTAKAPDMQYTYNFAGWSPAVSPAAANITYTAQYTQSVREYAITFMVNGVPYQVSVAYGETPVFDGSTERPGYLFNGWLPEIAAVSGNATYTAQYVAEQAPKFSITFVTHDGSETLQFTQGQAVTYPEPSYYDDNGTRMVFGGWKASNGVKYSRKSALPVATANETYTAYYITNDGDDGWGALH